MTRQTLIVAADRFGDRSLSYPYYRLQEAGHEVDIASPGGKSITGLNGVEFEADRSIGSVDPDAYDLLVLPGGYSSETIRMKAPDAIEYVRAFDAANKPIASVCHGAQLLISAGVVEGRRLACHPSIKDDVERAGGTVVDDAGVVDGNLVTARDYSDNPEWIAAVLAQFADADTSTRGYDYQPIGTIHSEFDDETGMPIQGAFSDSMGVVEVEDRLEPGLEDIDGFSHLMLLYAFHNADSYDLRVEPFMEDREHGVFATRAPRRPNHIGLSVVELRKVSGSKLFVNGLDVIDGTPLLDVKPFVPAFNGVQDADIGWLEGSIQNEQRRTADDRFVD
jgi:protease I